MRLLIFIPLLWGCIAFPQVSYDFESGMPDIILFSDDGRWGLDSDSPLQGTWSLHHTFDNTSGDCDVAGWPLQGLDPDISPAIWQFTTRYGYPPSSSNRWSFWLMADGDPVAIKEMHSVSGYVAGVNLKGYDDTLRLWKVVRGDASVVLSTGINWQNDIGTTEPVTISVERRENGIWHLAVYTGTGILWEGEGQDQFLCQALFGGLAYHYTASCDRLIWLDDVTVDGTFCPDTIPPVVVSARFLSNTVVEIVLDEGVGWAGEEGVNLVTGDETIMAEMVTINGSRIRARFSTPLPNRRIFKVEPYPLQDIEGNIGSGITTEISLGYPEFGDIIITEIMADPSPVVGLPEAEYLELHNPGSWPVSISSLGLVKGDRTYPLPDSLLQPGDYLAITSAASASLFEPGERVAGINTFPTLGNSGDRLLLVDTLTGTVHGVEYSSDWYNDVWRSEGGWSLEMIDTGFPFFRNNWEASKSNRGGTPGESNSVAGFNPDTYPPVFKNIWAENSDSVLLTFSETVLFNPLGDFSVKIDGYPAERINRIDSLRMYYSLIPAEHLTPGRIYSLVAEGVSDHAGNRLNDEPPRFGLASEALEGDLIINEVLFETLADGREYIEFFNRSPRIIDAARFRVAAINRSTGDTTSLYNLSDENRAILPGGYYAITSDPGSVSQSYPSGDERFIFGVGGMPSLPDTGGELLLFMDGLVECDRAPFGREMHLDIITASDGVSLERIDPDQPSEAIWNWHSATGLSGWGTPGSPNSVMPGEETGGRGKVSLSSKSITPDNDGYHDILEISCDLGSGDWIVNCTIYDDMGYPVRELLSNTTATGSERFFWDGSTGNGSLVQEGIYIIYFKAISAKGETVRWKGVCAVLLR